VLVRAGQGSTAHVWIWNRAASVGQCSQRRPAQTSGWDVIIVPALARWEGSAVMTQAGGAAQCCTSLPWHPSAVPVDLTPSKQCTQTCAQCPPAGGKALPAGQMWAACCPVVVLLRRACLSSFPPMPCGSGWRQLRRLRPDPATTSGAPPRPPQAHALPPACCSTM